MSAEGQTMYLTNEWFDSTDHTLENSDTNGIDILGNDWVQPTNTIYYTQTYWWPYPRPEKKIKLTLTEVEHLRKLAANDKRLRKTMKKFAPMIEIEVDFPGGDDD